MTRFLPLAALAAATLAAWLVVAVGAIERVVLRKMGMAA